MCSVGVDLFCLLFPDHKATKFHPSWCPQRLIRRALCTYFNHVHKPPALPLKIGGVRGIHTVHIFLHILSFFAPLLWVFLQFLNRLLFLFSDCLRHMTVSCLPCESHEVSPRSVQCREVHGFTSAEVQRAIWFIYRTSFTACAISLRIVYHSAAIIAANRCTFSHFSGPLSLLLSARPRPRWQRATQIQPVLMYDSPNCFSLEGVNEKSLLPRLCWITKSLLLPASDVGQVQKHHHILIHVYVSDYEKWANLNRDTWDWSFIAVSLQLLPSSGKKLSFFIQKVTWRSCEF